MVTEADEVMVIAATEVIAATVVIVIVAKATATEVEVAMAVAVMVHRTVLLTLLLLLLAPQFRTLKLLTITLNMPSGPLTTQLTQLRTHTLPMAVLPQLWPNTRKATDSTTVKLTQPDRRSLLLQVLEPQHHRLLPQSLQAMELHRLLRHHLLDLQEPAATVQYLPRQACKWFAASSISPKCTDPRYLVKPFQIALPVADYLLLWFRYVVSAAVIVSSALRRYNSMSSFESRALTRLSIQYANDEVFQSSCTSRN
jgi:hypothetical protein